MNFKYQCKICKTNNLLINNKNVKKIKHDNLEFTFFICDECKTVEVIQIDNQATKKLLNALMFKLVSKETSQKGFKSAKKRLENKRKALLNKYLAKAKECFKGQNISSEWADEIYCTWQE